MRCDDCNIEMRVDRATRENPYRFDRCGLDNVFLIGIERYVCPRCKAIYPMIPRIQELHAVIASILIEKSGSLTGQELRYLRKWIGVEAQVFADLLQVRPEHLSKVENGRIAKLGATADRLARVYAMTYKNGQEFQEIFERVQRAKKNRERAELRRQYHFSGKGWKAEQVADAA
jgi:DNA-binding transcriptional regulator YiaG